MLPQDCGQGRFSKKINFVRVGDCSPVVTSLQGAFRRIDDEFVVAGLGVPVWRQGNHPLEVAFFEFRIESAFVKWV